MVKNISGVILAGGAGRRFRGITKSNFVLGGVTIISRILNTIRDIFEEIIIVTNTPGEFQDYSDLIIVSDLFKGAGPLGGIHSAICASSREAVFVFAGDMPLLEKKIILRQTDLYNEVRCDILVPSVSSYIEPLHAIYNISLKGVLERYLKERRDYAVREFITMADTRYLSMDDMDEAQTAFTNINSPSDVQAVKKILGIH
jgi:molybdopterin-guanine dinucleotide biosynthesis protein A